MQIFSKIKAFSLFDKICVLFIMFFSIFNAISYTYYGFVDNRSEQLQSLLNIFLCGFLLVVFRFEALMVFFKKMKNI